METIFGIETARFMYAFWWIAPLVIIATVLAIIFSYLIGRNREKNDHEGFSVGTLDPKCVYRVTKKFSDDGKTLTLVLKEKTSDGVERMRSKTLETSLSSIRDSFDNEYSFNNLPEYFLYKENYFSKGGGLIDYKFIILVFKSISMVEYETFGG